jgi:hypothetical protein
LCWQLGSVTDFWSKFCWKPTPHDTKDPMKLFLVHTVLFVASTWKNKSGWFLFVMSLWLLVAAEIVLTAGIRHWFLTQVLLKTNPAWHQRPSETLPCPYNAVHCIYIPGDFWFNVDWIIVNNSIYIESFSDEWSTSFYTNS